jgi:hypothetical protein
MRRAVAKLLGQGSSDKIAGQGSRGRIAETGQQQQDRLNRTD